MGVLLCCSFDLEFFLHTPHFFGFFEENPHPFRVFFSGNYILRRVICKLSVFLAGCFFLPRNREWGHLVSKLQFIRGEFLLKNTLTGMFCGHYSPQVLPSLNFSLSLLSFFLPSQNKNTDTYTSVSLSIHRTHAHNHITWAGIRQPRTVLLPS